MNKNTKDNIKYLLSILTIATLLIIGSICSERNQPIKKSNDLNEFNPLNHGIDPTQRLSHPMESMIMDELFSD